MPLLLAGLFATACDSGPSGPAQNLIDDGVVDDPRFSTQLYCEADRTELTVSCEVRAPGASLAGAPSADLIVGNQGTYMQLTSSNVAFDEGNFTFDVAVTNLLPQPIGTPNGTTLSPNGIRVFFHSGPNVTSGSGVVTVVPDGVGTFTASDQPFYQYDEIVAPGDSSSARMWTLTMPASVETFAFTVFVSADVPFPDGFVDLDADSVFVQPDSTLQLNAEVRTAVGLAAGGSVSFESSDTTVAVVDAAGVVTGLRSGFATITASAGEAGELSGSTVIGVCPMLAVGEAITTTMPHGAELCISGGNGVVAEYMYAPVHTGSGATTLDVSASGITAVAGPPTPQLNPARGAALNLTVEGLLAAAPRPARQPITGSRLSPRQAISSSLSPGQPSRLIVPGVPSIGDEWSLNVAIGCDGTPDIRGGRVVSVSSNFIIVEDTLNPAGGFTSAEYESIGLELDTLVWEPLSTNFGEPADLDSNERVVVFFTRAMNELSPPGSGNIYNADFQLRDLFSSAAESCPRSNEGEMLYALVPDPAGEVNGNVRTKGLVRDATIGTLARELQSLINASRRIYENGHDLLEEEWLDEGLSRIAEELAFYRASGLTPGSNITLDMLLESTQRLDAFNELANRNFSSFRLWFERPDTTGPLNSDASFASLGALWAFLRYAADRVGTDNQETFWSSLIDSDLEGTANLANAIGADPDEWLRDFVAAFYVDDVVPGIAPEYTNPSWHYRSIFPGAGGFPLLTTPLADGTTTSRTFGSGGSTAFFRFSVPSDSYASLTTLAGDAVPTAPLEMVVVRTK